MSVETTLMTWVPAFLIENLSAWTEDNCKVQPDDKLEPVGQSPLCVIKVTEVLNTKADDHVMEEVPTFDVIVARRITAIPLNRIVRSIYLTHWNGLMPLISQIKHVLNNRWKFINYLNTKHTADYFDDGDYIDEELTDLIDSQQFATPFLLQRSLPQLTYHLDDFHHGGPPQGGPNPGYTTVSTRITFSGSIFVTRYKEEICL